MFEGKGGNIVTTFFDWLKGGKQATPTGPSPSTPSAPTGPVTVPPGTPGTGTIGADTPTGLTKAP